MPLSLPANTNMIQTPAMNKSALEELASRLGGVAELSLLHHIPIPCPGGYTYLKRADLESAAAALRALAKEKGE